MRKSRFVLILLPFLLVACFAQRSFSMEPNVSEFADTCASISQMSRSDWSTMGVKSLNDAMRLPKISLIRQAIWLGADPARLKGSLWYNYAKREHLNVLLIAAVASDEDSRVTDLLKQGANPNIDAQMDNVMTPLITASRCGSVGVVEALLQAGANANAHVKYGADGGATITDSTALRWASERGNDSIVQILIEANAAPNVQETIIDRRFKHKVRRGTSAILMAPTREILDLLLKSGASPNISNWLGYTALMKAAEQGSMDKCLVLLRFGAVKSLRSVSGKTASNLAVAAGHRDVANFIDGWRPR